MGNINVHIAKNTPDYIQGDVIDGHVPIPDDLYKPDIPVTHNSMEVENTCPQGKLLLSLCKAIPLCILNGRCLGDSCGHSHVILFTIKGLLKTQVLLIMDLQIHSYLKESNISEWLI